MFNVQRHLFKWDPHLLPIQTNYRKINVDPNSRTQIRRTGIRNKSTDVIVVVVYHVTIVAIGHGKLLPLVIDCVLRTLQGIQLMNKTFTEILTQPQSSIELLTDMPMISK